MTKSTGKQEGKKTSWEALAEAEAARVTKAVAVPVYASEEKQFSVEVQAGGVAANLDALWDLMVDENLPVKEALARLGFNSRAFFEAMKDNEVRTWYRDVKAAQALLKLEEVEEILAELAEATDDSLPISNAVRNAKIGSARLKLDQLRWQSTKLLGPLGYGDKPQETHSKVEIVVRRETKAIAAAAVSEAIQEAGSE